MHVATVYRTGRHGSRVTGTVVMIADRPRRRSFHSSTPVTDTQTQYLRWYGTYTQTSVQDGTERLDVFDLPSSPGHACRGVSGAGPDAVLARRVVGVLSK